MKVLIITTIHINCWINSNGSARSCKVTPALVADVLDFNVTDVEVTETASTVVLNVATIEEPSVTPAADVAPLRSILPAFKLLSVIAGLLSFLHPTKVKPAANKHRLAVF